MPRGRGVRGELPVRLRGSHSHPSGSGNLVKGLSEQWAHWCAFRGVPGGDGWDCKTDEQWWGPESKLQSWYCGPGTQDAAKKVRLLINDSKSDLYIGYASLSPGTWMVNGGKVACACGVCFEAASFNSYRCFYSKYRSDGFQNWTFYGSVPWNSETCPLTDFTFHYKNDIDWRNARGHRQCKEETEHYLVISLLYPDVVNTLTLTRCVCLCVWERERERGRSLF